MRIEYQHVNKNSIQNIFIKISTFNLHTTILKIFILHRHVWLSISFLIINKSESFADQFMKNVNYETVSLDNIIVSSAFKAAQGFGMAKSLTKIFIKYNNHALFVSTFYFQEDIITFQILYQSMYAHPDIHYIYQTFLLTVSYKHHILSLR